MNRRGTYAPERRGIHVAVFAGGSGCPYTGKTEVQKSYGQNS
jgi:hypothetical protein